MCPKQNKILTRSIQRTPIHVISNQMHRVGGEGGQRCQGFFLKKVWLIIYRNNCIVVIIKKKYHFSRLFGCFHISFLLSLDSKYCMKSLCWNFLIYKVRSLYDVWFSSSQPFVILKFKNVAFNVTSFFFF
jgi:hypothetical protein